MEVDRGVHAAGRQKQVHAAHAGNAAHQRIDGGLHQRGGDGGVHDVAAGPQDVGAGFGGLGLRGRDHCVSHYDGSSACMGRPSSGCVKHGIGHGGAGV